MHTWELRLRAEVGDTARKLAFWVMPRCIPAHDLWGLPPVGALRRAAFCRRLAWRMALRAARLALRRR